jgi:hypothetical protein
VRQLDHAVIERCNVTNHVVEPTSEERRPVWLFAAEIHVVAHRATLLAVCEASVVSNQYSVVVLRIDSLSIVLGVC